MDKVFSFIFQKYGEKKCLGSRVIIREDKEKQPDGKIHNKLVQGDYKWMTYNQASIKIHAFLNLLRCKIIFSKTAICNIAIKIATFLPQKNAKTKPHPKQTWSNNI